MDTTEWNLDNLTPCGEYLTFSIHWNLDNLTICGNRSDYKKFSSNTVRLCCDYALLREVRIGRTLD